MKKLALAAMAAMITVPTIMPAPVMAQERVYRGHHHRYHYRCKRSSGTTGIR